MKYNKFKIAFVIVLLLLAGSGYAVWKRYGSSTDVAFVNFSIVETSEMYRSNTNSHIKIHSINIEHTDADEFDQYDMVLINGMGLKMTEEQLERTKQLGEKGLPIAVVGTRNPSLQFSSVDSTQLATIKEYLQNATRTNYRNFFAYIRKEIDKKYFFAPQAQKPIEAEDYLFTHSDLEHPEAEVKSFSSVQEVNKYLKTNKRWKDNAPTVVITGSMGDPTDLTEQLENRGIRVYQTSSLIRIIRKGMIDSIKPNMIVNFAHGRMGNFVVNYLKQANIPLFSPLNVNTLADEWQSDAMGMTGGFLSQSVVTPEIDGALLPFALFAIYQDKEGMPLLRTIPERLPQFVNTLQNYAALQSLHNQDKRLVIYYYKGPGHQALTAQGMEVLPSLYNLLKYLREKGYNVKGLPENQEAFNQLIMQKGALFNPYAEGAMEKFFNQGNPIWISKDDYTKWAKLSLNPSLQKELENQNGPFPGSYMVQDDKLALSCIQLGNIALMPQYPPAPGNDNFKIVHGTKTAPPYPYISEYLWAQHEWKANAIIHLGTHGSLEFLPHKQVALSNNDWADRLVGSMPHFYIYTIGNVGESIIAKRRSYASLVSYLTPPFMETQLRKTYAGLEEALLRYDKLMYDSNSPKQLIDKAAMDVKSAAVKLGIHKDLRLDDNLSRPYTSEEISRIEAFSEELANEKITGKLYTLGVPYSPERIVSSVYAMSTEPIAYSLLALDKLKGRAFPDTERRSHLFTQHYLTPAKAIVAKMLQSEQVTDNYICQVAGITIPELQEARAIQASQMTPDDLMAMMMNAAALAEDSPKPTTHLGKRHPGKTSSATNNPTWGKHPKMNDEPINNQKMAIVRAISEIEQTIYNVSNYKKLLEESPSMELAALENALKGGYTAPSPGGDAIAHPNTLPTGRNMFSVNAESTPSESAWEKGKIMAQQTLNLYKEQHNGKYPRKISYTLWSGEFIESEGATIAQILYMLGVEPIRDGLGRVTDIRLIPISELGRPRIDIVVQTSGQLRDLAASRLFLINRAVEMAASAKDAEGQNLVKEGVTETERYLVEKGMTPKQARQLSTYRVFGGINGNYGTAITGMVESGDKWEDRSEIAQAYLNNMGAFYGSQEGWQSFHQNVFAAALTHTDAVIQPRQNNTWGALSLDHVYEFMGGISLAVKEVTGKEPEAYFADYRNRNRARIQDLKEAIGVESKTTILNPTYIREKMKGTASSADELVEIIRNTYGWTSMRQSAIEQSLWDDIYKTYIDDIHQLGVKRFFEEKNPAALQEFTGIMLESARKGLWKATNVQIQQLSSLHAQLIQTYQASCSQFVCGNTKLRNFISKRLSQEQQKSYQENLNAALQKSGYSDKEGMVMKKETTDIALQKDTTHFNNIFVISIVVLLIAGIIIYLRKRTHQKEQ